MKYKQLFYFTGHCLALDEHPEFREQIIELFADDALSVALSLSKGLSKDATRNPSVPERVLPEQPRNPSVPEREAVEGKIQNFIQLCSDHLIIPAIYLQFRKHNLLTHLPEEVEQVFAEIYDLNRERNQQILRQIDDITAVLNKENIQPVFLKGTANLLDGLYSDVGERMIGDIDFLVKEEDYFRTAAILEGNGYTHKNKATFINYQTWKHYPRLYKDGAIATVEIHRTLVSDWYSSKLKPELVFSDKKEVPEKPGLFLPSDRHKLIHTFIHDQLEDRGYAYKQASFRGLYDLYLLSKRVDVSSLVGQTGYRRKAISWFVLSQRVLGMPGSFYPSETKSAKWFCLKYNLALTFIQTHNVYTFLKKLIHLFGKQYAGTFIKALLSPAGRQYMYKKIKNPEWYRDYFK